MNSNTLYNLEKEHTLSVKNLSTNSKILLVNKKSKLIAMNICDKVNSIILKSLGTEIVHYLHVYFYLYYLVCQQFSTIN